MLKWTSWLVCAALLFGGCVPKPRWVDTVEARERYALHQLAEAVLRLQEKHVDLQNITRMSDFVAAVRKHAPTYLEIVQRTNHFGEPYGWHIVQTAKGTVVRLSSPIPAYASATGHATSVRLEVPVIRE